MTSLSAWYGLHYYCIVCEVCYNSNHTCKPVRICTKCSETNCLIVPTFTRCFRKCFGAFHNNTCFRNHLGNGVCDNSKSCDTCDEWFIGPVFDRVCNLSYCIYCSKFVEADHHCFIEVKKRSDVKSWIYVFYNFECTQNTIDTDIKQPVHEVNYCIAMSICDKCPYDGSCDNCVPVHTLSGLGGQHALQNFGTNAFDHPVNEWAVFIAHNSSNYDTHFILSYLITNREYPEILMVESCWKSNHLETIQINPWSGSHTAKKPTGVSYRHARSVGGEMYLKKGKAWVDAFYKTPRHEHIMAFMGCHFRGCQTCFVLSTMNTHLNNYMGGLYRQTMRWVARVTNSGYMTTVMWECEWGNFVKENSELKEHVDRLFSEFPTDSSRSTIRGQM